MNEVIGSVGVFLLLAAYFMNLFGMLGHESFRYRMMNALGAGLAAYASYLIDFIPFVVLESTWLAVSVFALVRSGGGSESGGAADVAT
jgi:hypothetical protein